jgi:hypothetical protein
MEIKKIFPYMFVLFLGVGEENAETCEQKYNFNYKLRLEKLRRLKH